MIIVFLLLIKYKLFGDDNITVPHKTVKSKMLIQPNNSPLIQSPQIFIRNRPKREDAFYHYPLDTLEHHARSLKK